MDTGVMAFHAGHELREGGRQQSIPWLGGSDSQAVPSQHVQGAWQTPVPSSPLSSLQTFAEGSHSGKAKQ